MELQHEEFTLLFNVAIAAVLSALVGIEREKLDKPAGLRTNIIVGSISCFFVSLSPLLGNFMLSNIDSDLISIDPIRILQAIIIGVSFIGAGTILKSKENNKVNNLTTASTLLYSAGIGIAVALTIYIVAVGLTVLILIVNSLHFLSPSKSITAKKNDIE